MNPNAVAAARCGSYEESQVRDAVKKIFDLLGGIETLIKPGDHVLLKPNVLAPRRPELAVTTHPAVIKAVAQMVLRQGGTVMVGDSSGGIIAGNYPTAKSFAVSGIEEMCRKLDIELINFDTAGTERIPVQGGFLREIEIARPVLDADVVINLPKLKTHSSTIYSGAVKNQFGMVPGRRKSTYHAEAATTQQFSSLLADIYQYFPPAFSLMDGIIAMEGNGPAHGIPRPLGILAGAVSSVLLDAYCCYLIGLDPKKVGHLKEVSDRGLCPADFKYDLLGDETPSLRDFKMPRNLLRQVEAPGLKKYFLSRLKMVPVCNRQECMGCRMCVDSCPVQAMTMEDGDRGVLVDKKRCIECLCCQELCPQGAIKVQAENLIGALAAKMIIRD